MAGDQIPGWTDYVATGILVIGMNILMYREYRVSQTSSNTLTSIAILCSTAAIILWPLARQDAIPSVWSDIGIALFWVYLITIYYQLYKDRKAQKTGD